MVEVAAVSAAAAPNEAGDDPGGGAVCCRGGGVGRPDSRARPAPGRGQRCCSQLKFIELTTECGSSSQ